MAKTKHARLELFTGSDGDWYWRFIASNGEEIARSSEGYRRKIDCSSAFEALQDCMSYRTVVTRDIVKVPRKKKATKRGAHG